jgi:diaminopimelate epimerase
MRKIEFSKYHGQGNDFILMDATKKSIPLNEEKIRKICDRHKGIGADGLILVKSSDEYDYYMDFYNMDGSKAEMCGNGIRCMAGFIFDQNLSRERSIKIDTLAGVKAIEMDIKGNLLGNISVDMGKPIFSPKDIPVKLEMDEVFGYKMPVENRVFEINCISIGNPHCIIFLDDSEDLEKIPLDVWGPALEKNSIFPNKTNVEFIKMGEGNQIDMRVWERGVGETLACGTGACAAGVCTIKLKKINGSEVNVKVPGGRLQVNWSPPAGSVFLKGRVKHVYDGFYFLDLI